MNVKIISLLLLVVFGSCGLEEQDKYIFRVGHVANEDHTWHQALLYFGKILDERTNGKIEIQVYPGEQLGKERELIRSIQAGIVDITITGGTLENWVDVAGLSDMPYLIESSEHLRRITESEIGKQLSEKILKESGLRPIAIFERGPRNLTSNRPIKKPRELNGLIIRIPNVSTYVTVWNALGAKPTPMAFSEVFTGLQQGTVEAQENPLAMIYSASFFEVQDYLNLTEHVISWGYVVLGDKQFQEMPPDLQKIFLEAAEEMQHYENQLFLEKEAFLEEELKSKGMTFVEVDKEAFKQIAEKALFESLSDEMQDLFLEIKALAD